MGKMTKADAIKIVVRSAEDFKKNLIGYSLLFILMDKHKKTSYLEVTFRESGFLHLTGLRIPGLSANTEELSEDSEPKTRIHSAAEFFNLCLGHNLSENDFEFAKDGTTEVKLEVLPLMMSANLGADTVGDFNHRQPKLFTEKMAGGVKGCMGFCRDYESGLMVPNTLLNGDIRTFTGSTWRIIATYRKLKSDPEYEECVRVAKKVDWSKINFPEPFSYIPVPEAKAESEDTTDAEDNCVESNTKDTFSEEQKNLIDAYVESARIFIRNLGKKAEEAVDQLQVPGDIREEVVKRLTV